MKRTYRSSVPRRAPNAPSPTSRPSGPNPFKKPKSRYVAQDSSVGLRADLIHAKAHLAKLNHSKGPESEKAQMREYIAILKKKIGEIRAKEELAKLETSKTPKYGY